MKKTLLIAIGTIIVLTVVGVWAYLFTFGTPESAEEVFTKFGLGGEEIVPTVVTETTIVDVAPETSTGAPQKLRQLTTRPVAGATFVENTLRYVEQGTGHVYDIDLTTGTEKLLRGTTIPQTIDAVFSPDGAYVALTTYSGATMKTTLAHLLQESDNESGTLLPENATDIAFTKNTTLNYVIHTQTDTSGFLYDINKKTTARLFTIPLRDVRIVWGATPYAYTTPSGTQTGYVYEIKSGALSYLYPGKLGLTATPFSTGTVLTATEQNGSEKNIVSVALNKTGGEQYLPIAIIPEKCVQVPNVEATLYCAAPVNITSGIYPDDWYKGKIAYTDLLWKVNITDGESIVLSNFVMESGREVDVHTIGTDATGARIFMINKNDQTLWLFDTTL